MKTEVTFNLAKYARQPFDPERSGSAEGVPEQQPPSGAFPLATVSGSVSSAEVLAEKWDDEATVARKFAQISTEAGNLDEAQRWKGRQHAYRACAFELRRKMGAESLRQPTPNAASQQRAD